MDQAHNLRSILKKRNEDENENENTKNILNVTSRIFTVTSGKGGVGKTNLSVNLAINFASRGFRVVIVDTDFGLANIEVLLGSVPRYTFSDLIYGDKKIDEIISDGPMGIKFISGGSGLKELANLSEVQMNKIFKNFEYIDSISDIIIVDTGAGISKSVLNFVMSSKECILVTTPEPTSITDAYSLMKAIKETNAEYPQIRVIVNRTDDEKEGREVFARLSRVTSKFLNINLEYLGSLPYDRFLVKAVKLQKPVALSFPNSDVSICIKHITDLLLGVEEKETPKDDMKNFMKRMLKFLNK